MSACLQCDGAVTPGGAACVGGGELCGECYSDNRHAHGQCVCDATSGVFCSYWLRRHEACECGCERGEICPVGRALGLVTCAGCRHMAADGSIGVCVACQADTGECARCDREFPVALLGEFPNGNPGCAECIRAVNSGEG